MVVGSSRLGDEVARLLVSEDALFFTQGLVSDRLKPMRGDLGLVMIPLLSMFAIESSKWCQGVKLIGTPDLSAHQTTLANTRQRVKLLIDNQKNMDEVLGLAREIVEINQQWFDDLHKGPLRLIRKRFQKELGIAFINGRAFNTTISSLMNFGFSPDELKHDITEHKELGKRGFRFTYEIGEYLGWLLDELAIVGQLREVAEAPLPVRVGYLDLHTNDYLRARAAQISLGDESLVVILLALLTLANTANLILPLFTGHRWLPLLKWRFLLLYHVARNLVRLRDEHFKRGGILSSESATLIVNMLDDDSIRSLVSLSELRNTLVHYIVRPHVASQLDGDLPLHGFFEAAAKGMTPQEVANLVASGLKIVSRGLESMLTSDLVPQGYR